MFDMFPTGDVFHCPSDHTFRCASGEKVCQVKVCDGMIDCLSGDDEANCGKSPYPHSLVENITYV